MSPQITQGMLSGISDLKTSHNFVIIPSKDEYYMKKNIIACGLSVFLKKYLPDL